MRTWAEARADCVNQGGDLVSITDPFEQAFIQGVTYYISLHQLKEMLLFKEKSSAAGAPRSVFLFILLYFILFYRGGQVKKGNKRTFLLHFVFNG